MLAPHLVARVSAERRGRRFRTGDPSPWVVTTLRKSVQQRAVEILARHRRTLAENDVRNAAALVLDAPSGEVLAYVGNQWPPGGDEHGEHVDVIPARRSTGSVLKPLLYASMLEAGEVLPSQLVADVPTHMGAFHPENFDSTYAGAVPEAPERFGVTVQSRTKSVCEGMYTRDGTFVEALNKRGGSGPTWNIRIPDQGPER